MPRIGCGLAGSKWELKAGKAPIKDNLLVFYLPEESEWKQAVERMTAHGYKPVTGMGSHLKIQTATEWCCNTPVGRPSQLHNQSHSEPTGVHHLSDGCRVECPQGRQCRGRRGDRRVDRLRPFLVLSSAIWLMLPLWHPPHSGRMTNSPRPSASHGFRNLLFVPSHCWNERGTWAISKKQPRSLSSVL